MSADKAGLMGDVSRQSRIGGGRRKLWQQEYIARDELFQNASPRTLDEVIHLIFMGRKIQMKSNEKFKLSINGNFPAATIYCDLFIFDESRRLAKYKFT